MRIAIGLEYDGSAYNGWQRQKNGRTVQFAVEKAIAQVANHELAVVCAGRTDTGVHASCQVIHFDTSSERAMHSWVLGANANLPRDISVNWATAVSDEFHARFKAFERSYRYCICNRKTRPAIAYHLVTWNHNTLDAERMQAAANYLLGEHDFSSFRASECQAKSPVKTIVELKVTREGDYIYIDIRANAFLHHMVRNIAGVLMAIGKGDQAPEWAAEVLQYKDRSRGGVTALPNGLYLTGVRYPDIFKIPQTGYTPVFG